MSYLTKWSSVTTDQTPTMINQVLTKLLDKNQHVNRYTSQSVW